MAWAGTRAGNIASNLVVSNFNKKFSGGFEGHDVPDLLRESLSDANTALKQSIEETPGLFGMGCTMVGAALVRGKLFWVSVGDSHLYHLRDGELLQPQRGP